MCGCGICGQSHILWIGIIHRVKTGIKMYFSEHVLQNYEAMGVLIQLANFSIFQWCFFITRFYYFISFLINFIIWIN